MRKRLRIVVDEAELARIEMTARAAGLTLSEWVRQTLRSAQRGISSQNRQEKPDAVREAVRHSYPAPDIDVMLEESKMATESPEPDDLR